MQGITDAGREGEEPESRIRSDLVGHILLYMTAFIELKQAQILITEASEGIGPWLRRALPRCRKQDARYRARI